MATIYEYILKLNAQMQGMTAANSALQKTEQLANNAQRSLNGLGAKLKDAVNSIPGAGFLTNPVVMATAAVGAITKLGIENEKTAVSFEVLLQSQDKATKMLGEINKYAAETPYEKMGLNEAAKMMLGFGISQEKIMPNLKMLGDVAMSDANKLSSLSLAYSQVSSAGKLQGQDLLQMINAGFNPLNEISKMTGKSMGELRKEMEAGKISSDMVEAAFKHATSAGGMFYGMTEKMGDTLGGKLSTLIDSAKEKLLQLYDVIAPILLPAVDYASKLFDALTVPLKLTVSFIKGLFKELKDGNPFLWGIIGAISAYNIVIAIAAAKTALHVWYTGLSTTAIIINTLATEGWAAAWLAVNIAMKANPIGLIITLIAAVAAGVVYAYQKFGWFRGAVLGAWEAIKGFGLMIGEYVIDRFNGLLSGISGIGKALVQLFNGDFKAAWQTAKAAGSDLIGIDARKNAVKNAALIGKNMGAAYKQGVAEVVKNTAEQKGIAPVKVPGTVAGATSGTDTVTAPIKNGTETVASGGTRNTSIVINMGKFFDNIIFQGGLKENADDVKRKIEEMFAQILYAAQSAS